MKNIGWIDPVVLLKYLIPLKYFSHTVGSSPRVYNRPLCRECC